MQLSIFDEIKLLEDDVLNKASRLPGKPLLDKYQRIFESDVSFSEKAELASLRMKSTLDTKIDDIFKKHYFNYVVAPKFQNQVICIPVLEFNSLMNHPNVTQRKTI